MPINGAILRRRVYGGGSFDITKLVDYVWELQRGYATDATDVTSIPSAGLKKVPLVYSSAGTKATAVDLNGLTMADLVGGNTDAMFSADAAAGDIGAGTNVPFTMAGIIRFDSIAADSYGFYLDDGGGVTYNNHILQFRNSAVPIIRMMIRDPLGILAVANFSEANMANHTFRYVVCARADGTLDGWMDGAISIDAVPYSSGSMNAMTSLVVGASHTGTGGVAAEMNGQVGAFYMHPAELPRTDLAKISGYLETIV